MVTSKCKFPIWFLQSPGWSIVSLAFKLCPHVPSLDKTLPTAKLTTTLILLVWIDQSSLSPGNFKKVLHPWTLIKGCGPDLLGLRLKEETDRTGSILKAGLHLGPDCELWSVCPVSMETTYQLENQTPWMEEPQGSYLDSPLPKEYPNYLCNQIE